MVASSPSKERVSEPEEACIGQYRGKKSSDKSLRNIMHTRETLRQDMVPTSVTLSAGPPSAAPPAGYSSAGPSTGPATTSPEHAALCRS
jgi:hypothetical protein